METRSIYFIIALEEENYRGRSVEHDEIEAYNEIWEFLKPYAISQQLLNEGHNCYGELVCHFTIDITRVPALRKAVQHESGTLDNYVIFLENGFYAMDFNVIDKVGIDRGIDLDDWGM